MGKKLFVGNLSFSTSEDLLMQKFAEFGEVVSVKIITDKFSGKSRGFGFVEMANDAEADAAVEKLNGSEFDGRQVVVNEARPEEKRERSGNRRPGGFRREEN